MKWTPCPFCGNKHLELIGNPLCEIYGADMADVYCSKCQAKAPQKTWNKREVKECAKKQS